MKRFRPQSRSGQSLVEFAVVALVMYMLLAAIVTFGHMLYVAQGLQSAADLAAREISRTPLPVTLVSLDDDNTPGSGALSAEDVRSRIYDDAYLVFDLDRFYDANPRGSVFTDIVPSLPLLNQQLVTMMIVDRPIVDGVRRWLLRYPGALMTRNEAATAPSGRSYESWVEDKLTVGIPLLDSAGGLRWVGVVEEIESPDGDPFNVANPRTQGIVALRMNYPFQSAAMSSFRRDRTDPQYPFESTVGRWNLSESIPAATSAPGGTPINQPIDRDPNNSQTFGGNLGFGVQGAFGSAVRPYRRVISAQAIYRREIFSGPPTTTPVPPVTPGPNATLPNPPSPNPLPRNAGAEGQLKTIRTDALTFHELM